MSSPASVLAETPEHAIVAHGLTRTFGELVAVGGIELRVPRSSIYGFLGPNGSGKSTTIRMLCGLLTPDAGEIEVLGLRIPGQAEALKPRMGYMTQRFSLFEDLSVRENLEFVAAIQNLPKRDAPRRVEQLLDEFHLQQRHRQLAGTLSGGEKQRLALAGAVIHEPELLFLDEPTSAVDPESRRDFWDKLFDLAASGTTILVSTHYMDEAERCHRLAILDKGKLAADGTPQALRTELQGRTFLVTVAKPRAAQAALAAAHNVLSVAQIGNELRVLASETGLDQAEIEAILRDAHVTASVEAVPASLEDVFVAATRGRSAKRGQGPG